MSDVGKLIYRTGDGSLAYKYGGDGSLAFKGEQQKPTTITFAWKSDAKDLDICAFWNDAPDLKIGYGYEASSGEHVSGNFHIRYSGDETGTNVAEFVIIWAKRWTAARTFTVHLNFFGFNASSYPGNTCSIIAAQQGGRMIVKEDVPCGTDANSKALTSHPKCEIIFDAMGNLTEIR